MIKIADNIGRVMMAAVTLPRSKNTKSGVEEYVKTEFHKDDQAYVLMCMNTGRRVDIKNITV